MAAPPDALSVFVYLVAKNGLTQATQDGTLDELKATLADALQQLASSPLNADRSQVVHLAISTGDRDAIKTEADNLRTAVRARVDVLASTSIDWGRYDAGQKATQARIVALKAESKELTASLTKANAALDRANDIAVERAESATVRETIYKKLDEIPIPTDLDKEGLIRNFAKDLRATEKRKK